jgi:hypothetical protein
LSGEKHNPWSVPAALPDASKTIVHCLFASANEILKQVQNDGLRPDAVISRIISVSVIFIAALFISVTQVKPKRNRNKNCLNSARGDRNIGGKYGIQELALAAVIFPTIAI